MQYKRYFARINERETKAELARGSIQLISLKLKCAYQSSLVSWGSSCSEGHSSPSKKIKGDLADPAFKSRISITQESQKSYISFTAENRMHFIVSPMHTMNLYANESSVWEKTVKKKQRTHSHRQKQKQTKEQSKLYVLGKLNLQHLYLIACLHVVLPLKLTPTLSICN